VRRNRAEQPLARLGGGDAAGRAGEQAYADPLLQRADRVAEGGGRHAQLRGGTGEAARFGDEPERDEIVDRLARHC
jgi:hypothetical protein